MSTRLNAKLASAQTKKRIIELELEAQLAQARKRDEKKAAEKHNRAKNAQEKRIIQAAIEGEFRCEIHEDLYILDVLLERGFEVNYVNLFEFHLACEVDDDVDAENEDIDDDGVDCELLIKQFLNKVGNHSRFQGMASTRAMAIKGFKERINLYKSLLVSGEYPESLYSFVFDSRLYVYQPMPEFKPLLGCIEECLCQELGVSFVDDSDEDDVDTPDIAEYTSKLTISDANDPIFARKNEEDYFLIVWRNSQAGTIWEFDYLFSPEALHWLASARGQRFFDLLEGVIGQAIKKGETTARFIVGWNKADSVYKIVGYEVGGSVPYPDQFGTIGRLLGYKVEILEEAEDTTAIVFSW